MAEVLQFALLGLGLGTLYSLSAFGLIAVYRGSGVLNFAHGAMGMVGAYAAWEIHTSGGQPYLLAVILGTALSAAIGVGSYLLVMRPLRLASPLARTVATLGILIVLQSAAILRYGTESTYVAPQLPTAIWHPIAGVTITVDRFILLGVAIALCVALWLAYSRTSFGRGTGAVAENQLAASSLGWSPDRIGVLNWGLGSGLAGLAAILVAPILSLQATSMTSLVLAAMAAALFAGFKSFPVALGAGLAIGVLQTEADRYVHQPGFARSVPFLLIVVVMFLRGRGLPLRDAFLQRLPAVGDGRVRWLGVAAAVVVSAVLIGTLPVDWVDAIVVTFGLAIVLLSIVVLTGYTGQLSLGQFAFAGFGAWVAGRLVATLDVPFVAAVPIGVLAAVPLGLLFALPAVRTRGVQLAIITFGLGSGVELMLLTNGDYTGGFVGTEVGSPSLFGLDINSIEHPERYALVTLGCLLLASLCVANLRRGRSGRRLLSVRTNERAAAALGISPVSTKLYAFGLSAALAALGGVILAFRDSAIQYAQFDAFSSITAVGYAVIGGVGFVLGPVLGATLSPGAIGTQISDSLLSGIAEYVQLIGGVILIVLVLQNQDGIAKEIAQQARALGARLRRTRPPDGPPPPDAAPAPELPALARGTVAPRTLQVRGLSVRFGATTAVDDVSLTLQPRRVLGLIGPNGAGKTTFIDGVTGFVSPASGSILLDGEPIDRWNVTRRARAGLSRSFQSLELFEDLTVLDNLRAASDPRDRWSLIRDVVYPATPALTGPTIAAIREFGLADDLHQVVTNLPYGKRHLLAIARAVATGPSVLLLDEPAAGLGPTETAELSQLVRRLARDWGMAVLLIEHDVSFVMSVCDEIVVLDFGRKIAAGTPSEVRTDVRVLQAYLGEDYAQETTPGRTSTVTESSRE